MSEAMIKLELQIPEDSAGVINVEQFGMRYPDGTIKWVVDEEMQRTVSFKGLSEGDPTFSYRWEQALKSRATQAKMDVAQYAAAHQPVKRNIIVATTVTQNI